MRDQLAARCWPTGGPSTTVKHAVREVLAGPSPAAGRRALTHLALAVPGAACGGRRRSGVAWPRIAALQGRQQHDRPPGRARRWSSAAAQRAGRRMRCSACTSLFSDEPLVIDKWYQLQASATTAAANRRCSRGAPADAASRAFRSAIRTARADRSFCMSNPGGFHRADAAGYVVLGGARDELDRINPKVAARMARADAGPCGGSPRQIGRQGIARAGAGRGRAQLSRDVREIVTKSQGK